ncbi:5'(3')-deoxyribonucleotidase [Pseudomonas phage vB_PseuGesM_254]|uniref:5'(3')-deoxyribonucleotidase n=1 Tax=Pseudomonas phage vB_PseuGesM_254 TaxID=3092638 RepID=A0AAX4G6I2_9CAUD|nr:5'(3')-deoxyribonucleotidase [Pseudomonas phage PseuGes_254]
MRKILAVDVDEVVLSIWPRWLEWLNMVTNKDVEEHEVNMNYSLMEYFPEIDALDFWRQNYLYDTMIPRSDCLNALWDLKEHMDIGFVTYCKAGHFSSKCRFLKRYFPFVKFINATKEKGYTLCDYAIDDRNKHCNQYPNNVIVLKYLTPYTQDVELDREVIEVKNWKEIHRYLKGELYGRN